MGHFSHSAAPPNKVVLLPIPHLHLLCLQLSLFAEGLLSVSAEIAGPPVSTPSCICSRIRACSRARLKPAALKLAECESGTVCGLQGGAHDTVSQKLCSCNKVKPPVSGWSTTHHPFTCELYHTHTHRHTHCLTSWISQLVCSLQDI